MPLTNNINFLSPTSFKLTIDLNQFANLEFFLTSVTMPSITMNEVETNFRGHRAYVPGEPVNYDALNIRFAVDEDLKNYIEIHNWIVRNHNTPKPDCADMILSILSSHNNRNKEIQFKDAFPTSLGSFDLTARSQEVEYIEIDATFRYNEFKIIN